MRDLIDRLPPAVTALLLQAAAFTLALLGVRWLGIRTEPLYFSLLCGLIAATLSYVAGLAVWWVAIGLLFTPALAAMLTLDIPPVFFLAAFLVMLGLYWSTFKTQVPLYLSSDKVWCALEGLLPEGKFHFIDLGSGLGGVLTHLARVRPEGHYSGVESAPLPMLASRIRIRGLKNCEVHWGSLWNCDLAQYDVVFAYLSPVPMEKLWRKARAEMRAGTVFISSTFAVPDQAPHRCLEVDDLHRSTLLVWRM